MVTFHGVILAGGENSRFDGLPKGSLRWDGQSLFDRVHYALRSVTADVHASIHDERPPGLPDNVPLIRDCFQGIRGPMNGVYSALEELDEPVLVIPWDMPGINAMLLKELTRRWNPDEHCALTVLEGDRRHPFPGIYGVEAVESLRESLESDQWSMLRWLDNSESDTLSIEAGPDTDETSPTMMNVNRPGDIVDLQRLSDGGNDRET